MDTKLEKIEVKFPKIQKLIFPNNQCFNWSKPTEKYRVGMSDMLHKILLWFFFSFKLNKGMKAGDRMREI